MAYDDPPTRHDYSNVIAKERRGEYLGSTVQTIPHITTRSSASFTGWGSAPARMW